MIQLEYILRVLFWLACLQSATVNSYDDSTEEEPWRGRWFPFGPGQEDNNPVVGYVDDSVPNMMSTPDIACDDGKTNLTIDWDGGAWAYTCFMPRRLYFPNSNVSPVLKCEHIPTKYSARHKCMNNSISYDHIIPSYGTHRPVWAQYGEYRYLPRQRWLHNLEHGAVVMLYHPCADSQEVSLLRALVKSCLYRHVITADILVSELRPLALVTWGCTYEMSYVNADLVRAFIKKHALHGSEAISRDGLYDEQLLEHARVVSDEQDSQLCPSIATQHVLGAGGKRD